MSSDGATAEEFLHSLKFFFLCCDLALIYLLLCNITVRVKIDLVIEKSGKGQ